MNSKYSSMLARFSALAIIAGASSGLWVNEASAQTSGVTITPEIEVLYFDFFAAQGAGGDFDAGNFDDTFPDFDPYATLRYTISAETPDGLGGRVRFFNFQRDEFYIGRNREVEFRIVDAEAFFPISTGGTADFELFAGYRNAFIHLDGSDFGEENPYEFEGGGFTTGGSTSVPIMDSGFSFAFGGRYSLLFGDVNFQPVNAGVLDNVALHNLELFAGVDFERVISSMAVSAHLGWEVQYYGTDTYFPYAIDPETNGDTGLGGLVMGAAVRF